MSTTDPTPQNGTDGTDTITDLRDLRVGDRVVFGDRTQPLTVADLGERVHGTGDDEMSFLPASEMMAVAIILSKEADSEV